MTSADEFEAFVRRYQDMVFAAATRLLGSRVDAEDIAQMVFLKAFQRFDEIGPSPAAAGWLKTVTRNACLNHLTRHRARWRLFSEMGRRDSDGSETAFETTLVSEGSPELDLEKADQQARLEQALLGLPEHQRVPLVLFHFENADYREIAAALGVSVAKIKTDMHRGRAALRLHLSHDHGSR